MQRGGIVELESSLGDHPRTATVKIKDPHVLFFSPQLLFFAINVHVSKPLGPTSYTIARFLSWLW